MRGFRRTGSDRGGRQAAHASSIAEADLRREIRERIDLDGVLAAVVDSAARSLDCRRVSAWLTTGLEPPRLARQMGDAYREDRPPPALVAACAESAQPARNELTGAVALPLLAPRAGLVGVLLLERGEWSVGGLRTAEGIARDAGSALEAASLYERALAEKEKSDAVMARIADGVVLTDAHGRITEWNDAAARIFTTATQTAIGRRCAEVLALREGERSLECRDGCPLLGLTSDPGGVLGVEVWRQTDDGRRQPLLGSAQAVRDPDGSISDVVHSFRDVTRLKEADEAKTLFLATASHELKTPLTVIRGFASTLLEQDLDPPLARQALEAIERRAIELDHIIDGLLLSSRIESGRSEVHLSTVDLAPIVDERVAALARATDRDIHRLVQRAVSPVVADANGVAIVVDHLLNNAVKYSPHGGPIEVRLVDGPTVTMSVADHGIGMDPEQLAHCFDKFWQAESSTARRFGGTGIGLFIVRSLVEAMGGTVNARSRIGEGSVFHVRLPSVETTPAGHPDETAPQLVDARVGEPSVIREFMRQIGVPVRRQ